MSNHPIPPELRDMLGSTISNVIAKDVQSLAQAANKAALLGFGTTQLARLGRPPGEPVDSEPVTIVLVMSGPISDDQVEGLTNYVKGMQQDLETSGLMTPGSSKSGRSDSTPDAP